MVNALREPRVRALTRTTAGFLTVPQVVPWLGLCASVVSTIALALVLTRELGWLQPIPPQAATQLIPGDQPIERVIPPGLEAEISRLVIHGADDDLSEAERPSIADIQAVGAAIVITFGGHPDWRLTIREAEASGEAFLRADTIAAMWPSDTVPEVIRRYVSAIAKQPAWRDIWVRSTHERAVTWYSKLTENLSEPTNAAPASPVQQTGWVIVLCTLIIGNTVSAVLLVVGGGRPSQFSAAPARDWRISPLSGLTAALALGVAAFAVVHFHFFLTDYPYLVRAAHYPSGIAALPQVLSTMAHYQVGVFLGGGSLWFALTNVVLLAALCACWGVLLHRGGCSRDASVLAAALLALGPGTFFLLRWGDGVEHLSATTCLMLVLLLTDLAAREADRPPTWRYGLLVLALCLAALGVLMKFALMVLLPPSCWLWGRWLVPQPAPPMDRSATYLAFFVVVGGTIFLLPPGETSPLGFLPSQYALAAIGDRIWQYVKVALMFLALAAIWEAARTRSGRAAAAVVLAPIAGVLRSRVGRLPLIAWAAGVSVLWFLPFALHAGYEGGAYYGMLASAPLSALGALVISSAVNAWNASGWQRSAAACFACALLLPLGEIRSDLHQSETDSLPAWLDSVHALTAGRLRPERIVVVSTCLPSPAEPQVTTEVDAIVGKNGIWWATGWYDVPIEVRDDAPLTRPGKGSNVVTLGYCPGHPATIGEGNP